VRAVESLAEAEAILGESVPDLAVIDMEHEDSSALLCSPAWGPLRGSVRASPRFWGSPAGATCGPSFGRSTWGWTIS
jgi:hypothetical protein